MKYDKKLMVKAIKMPEVLLNHFEKIRYENKTDKIPAITKGKR
ncbi:MAG: hypothetical protein Kow0068_14570 [Marinilabiliales bacterium]